MTKNKVLWLLEYIVIILFILDTNTVYASTIDVDFHIPEVAAMLLFASLALRLFIYGIKRSTLNKYLSVISIYYVAIILVLIMSVGKEHMVSYIARFVLIFPMLILYFYCLAENAESISLIHKYVNVIAVLSVISLFFWVFASQLHLIAPTGSLRSGWGATQNGYVYPSYFGLYFERQKDTFFG